MSDFVEILAHLETANRLLAAIADVIDKPPVDAARLAMALASVNAALAEYEEAMRKARDMSNLTIKLLVDFQLTAQHINRARQSIEDAMPMAEPASPGARC